MLLVGIIINRNTWEVRQIINELESNQIKYKLVNNKKIYYKLTKVKDLKDKFDIILERSLSYLSQSSWAKHKMRVGQDNP